MASGRDPAPHEAAERIIGRKIAIRKIRFDRFLKSHNVNPLARDILPKLRATTRVPATSNIPKEVAHQMIRLRRCRGFVTTDVLEKGLSRGAIVTG